MTSTPPPQDPPAPEPRPEPAGPPAGESPAARADRRLVELLQELRVLQTGVQIVFAFLLGVAFTPRFAELGDGQQDIYVTTLLLAVLASAVFATPVALHRGLFRHPGKERIVRVSVRIAQLGLVLLASALSGAVLLVLDVVLGTPAAVVLTVVVALVFAGLWFVLPWAVRRPLRDGEPGGPTW
ncbi:DUF6328 family protein [Streptomyces rubellomurinus]|uniref:Membrane protein n=2 Tax=Streptomyces TaxID=1883 RepID=A0A0F2THG5_STRR3|nr:DUF6328 family protein [Streptomyces rubellomurinus]KJS54190.1 membrane protein [Streptomyces rubellomurinus subsp. indigoferus]KJS61710.1 membrane protein [Streptomyces rubellomurinus]